MKKLLAILALAATAVNAQYVDRLGNYLTAPPSPYAAADGRLIFNPTWGHILADGGREATEQETADWQAAQDAAALAAAEAAAQAEAQAALPTVFETGIAVLDLSLIHISEPTRLLSISYAVFCLKKKNITLLYTKK